MKRFLLLSLYFSLGFSTMLFELIGLRMIAPYVGSSLSVWSIVVSVVLLSLSFGYYFARKLKSTQIPAFSLSLSLFFIFLALFYKDISEIAFSFFSNSLFLSFILSFLFFALPSFILAALAPLVGDIVSEKNETKKTLSRLYLISSIGSVLGTLFAGLIFIPYFNLDSVLLGLSALWATFYFLFNEKMVFLKKLFFFFVVLFFVLFNYSSDQSIIPSAYGELRVEEKETDFGLQKSLYIDDLVHSSYFQDLNRPSEAYAYYYDLVSLLVEKPKKVYMIGGGTYTYPNYFLEKFPESEIFVSEINPKLTEIAKEDFALRENDRLKIFHQDGRIFLKKTHYIFDSIFLDVFGGYTVPAHLSTKEFVLEMHEKTNSEHGSVIVNLPGVFSSKYVQSFIQTYREVFPFVSVYLVRDNEQINAFQSIILIASKKELSKTDEKQKQLLLDTKYIYDANTLEGLILRDENAPVEFLAKSYRKFFTKKRFDSYTE